MTTQELERYSPQERALVDTAKAIGGDIVRYSESGAILIDLGAPALKERYNVLAPASTIAKADANFTPAISVVALDSKDFYPTGKGENTRYALSKVQLDQISKVAGIEDIGPQIDYFGDRFANVRITWTARMRRPDGTWQIAVGSREWLEEDEREQLLGTVPDWVLKDGPPDPSNATFNRWWNDRWFGQIKKHRLSMTETKARLRAYRSLLTVKGNYTKAELAKPFLVAATHFTPDTSDIRVLGMLMGQGTEAANLLYGPQPAHEDAIPGTCSESDDTGEHYPIDFGANEETGEIPTHGERPADDPVLPAGPHEGKPISEVARMDPDYVRKMLLGSGSAKWGTAAEAWLTYWHGGGGHDDIAF
jgi:hypothetical protein